MEGLESEAISASRGLTHSTGQLVAIAAGMSDVAAGTAAKMAEQTQQMNRISRKQVEVADELDASEKLLSKLGGVFSLRWRMKKGRKVTGATVTHSDKQAGGSSVNVWAESKVPSKAKRPEREKTEGRRKSSSVMDQLREEDRQQDAYLDEVLVHLQRAKEAAVAIGLEADAQVPALGKITEETGEVRDRAKQCARRATALL